MTSDRWATPERIRQLLAEDRGLRPWPEAKLAAARPKVYAGCPTTAATARLESISKDEKVSG